MSQTKQMSFDKYLDVTTLPMNRSILDAVNQLATSNDYESRGAVYTRSEVVEFILDIVGYKKNKNLFEQNILEPSFGDGSFLLPIIERLITSWKKHSKSELSIVEDLKESIRAVELHKETFYKTKRLIINKLIELKISEHEANEIVQHWLIQGDFLLEQQVQTFDYIVSSVA